MSFLSLTRRDVRRILLSACAAGALGGPCGLAQAQESPALFNVSTRGQVGTGDNVLIAGLVIEGSAPRTILFRVLGPTLSNFNVAGVLNDPTVTLYSGSSQIGSNDDWESDAASAQTARDVGLNPPSSRECVIVRTLAPGAYTAIVNGKNSTTGVALVEAYDLDTRASTAPSFSRVLNLATRGRVGTGDNVLITGFVLYGSQPRNLLINAIAGSLAEFNVSGVLQDPKIELYNAAGQKIAEDDDWISSSNFEAIANTGASPRDPLESSLWVQLNPGAYTAVVSGVAGGQGIAMAELYEFRSVGAVRFSPNTLADRTARLVVNAGTSAETLELSFTGGAVAKVGTGANGTYTYTASDNFRGTINLDASGYTLTGNLIFYRNGVAVFTGKLRRPGAAEQDSGGLLVLN
jgi:hypothetical protein